MKVLILGSGAREHALGWAVRQADPSADVLFCPGNGGTRRIGPFLAGRSGDPVRLEDMDRLIEAARLAGPDLTIVGPEVPLVAGIADRFRAAGLPVFGPSARAAAIEGSKVFSKNLMRRHGIPTPAFDVFATPQEARSALCNGMFPKVIKADGLAAGKGVVIARSRDEAERAIEEIMERRRFGGAGDQVLVEAFQEGEEVSAFAIARGTDFRLLPLAQDHKRAGEGDTGENTGGMGAYAPVTRLGADFVRAVSEEVFAPALRALAEDGRPFSGLLYAGLVVAHGRPSVLEFNCRFGDPETEALVPLLGAGFLEALIAAAAMEDPLPPIPEVRCASAGEAGASAATVVLASAGYPGQYQSGFPITGIEKAEELPETFVFHAGTRLDGHRLVTAGGRVLAVTGRGPNLKEALRRAYEGCSVIEFEGKTLRRDIGNRGLV